MTLIGRVELGPSVGIEALEAVPKMMLQLEDIRSLADEPWRLVVWASGDDFETYETGLTEDPTIDAYTCLTQLPDKRLYRIVLSKEGQQHTLHPIAIEQDIVIMDLKITAERQVLLARFPSRDAVFALRDACSEKGRNFDLLNLYEEKEVENDGGYSGRYGVTTAQEEALLAALKEGYFNIPRQTTMEALANDLGISTSALSTRLRRGQQALLHTTLAQE